jgi:hypothetical protein
MRTAQLRKRPRHFKNFTGLSVEQFESLVEAVKAAGACVHKEVTPRQRAIGGGRKAKLELEDKLVLALMYYRLYLTQLLLGYLFNLDDSNVSRIITKLRPLLLEVLPLPVQETLMFAREEQGVRKRIATLDELLQRHPEFKEVLVDATEQETYKPNDRVKRRGRYSGKKKRHTLKTQVTTSRNGLLLHVSRSIAGKVNDLTLLRGSGVLRELPSKVHVRLDRGYDGVEQDYPDRLFHQPHKARRNKPLDFIQKLANKLQNRFRVPVENALAHLKRFKLLAGIYRGPDQAYDDTFLAISGLHNFRKLDRLTW